MSRGHNKHKGFSQTSKKFDGEIKEQRQRSHSSQHSADTGKHTEDDKEPKKQPGTKVTQAT